MTLNKNENLANQICKIEYELTKNVSQVKEGSSQHHKEVVFSSGGEWKEIYISPGSVKYAEPSKEMAAGTIFNQKLSSFYPGDDESSLPSVSNITMKPILLKITYGCGSTRLLGTIDNPAKLLPSYMIGNKSGRMFDFKRQSSDEIYILEE